MDEKKKDPFSDLGGQIRGAGPAMMIPGLLLAGPIVGFLIGRWIGDRVFDQPKGGAVVGLLLGFAAAVREVLKVVRGMEK